MRKDGALFRKPLGMFFLLLQERFRYKKRKIGVNVSGRLEHIVQSALHLFPDRITVRLDHHAAAHGAVLGKTGTLDDLVVPLGIVFRTFWKGFTHIVALLVALSLNCKNKN